MQIRGHLCLLIGFSQQKSKLPKFVIRSSSQFGESCLSWALRLPQKLAGNNAVFLDGYISKAWLPCP